VKINFTNSSPVLGEVVEDRRGRDYQRNNHPVKLEQRRELRKNATPAEARLWSALKGRQLNGKKWRRQFSIGPYILDFYSPAAHLAVELDGENHFTESGAEADALRTRYLRHHGVRVLRFENSDVWRDVDGVLQIITKNLDPSVLPDTSPKTGEEFEEKLE